MRKLTIAVDIDEVLMPHFQELADWYNQQFGTHLTLADNHPKSLEAWGTATIEEAVRRVHRFYSTPAYQRSLPFDEAIEAMDMLRTRHSLYVITARDSLLESLTRDWLDKHFSGVFQEAHFTAQYSLEGKNRTKAEVAKGLRADYLIDDDLGHILGASEVGMNGLLFGDYPWNQADELPENVWRMSGWPAVLEYFDARG